MHWVSDLEYEVWKLAKRAYGHRWLPWLSRRAVIEYHRIRAMQVAEVYRELEEE